MAGAAKSRARVLKASAAVGALDWKPGAPGSELEAAKVALQSIGAAGSEQELEQEILIFSKRARALAAEVAKGNAMLASKDARIAELEAELAKLKAPAKK